MSFVISSTFAVAAERTSASLIFFLELTKEKIIKKLKKKNMKACLIENIHVYGLKYNNNKNVWV